MVDIFDYIQTTAHGGSTPPTKSHFQDNYNFNFSYTLRKNCIEIFLHEIKLTSNTFQQPSKSEVFLPLLYYWSMDMIQRWVSGIGSNTSLATLWIHIRQQLMQIQRIFWFWFGDNLARICSTDEYPSYAWEWLEPSSSVHPLNRNIKYSVAVTPALSIRNFRHSWLFRQRLRPAFCSRLKIGSAASRKSSTVNDFVFSSHM